MTDQLIGDPIDPNEPFVESLPAAPIGYASPYGDPGGGSMPGQLPGDRPGEAVAAAALSLVTAGLLLITGFVVILAASPLDSGDDVETGQRSTMFVLAGLTNVIAAALLIIGAVLLLGQSSGARGPLALGSLICLALGVFWLANDQGDDGVLVWLVIFCVPAATATILAASARVTLWLRGTARPV